MVKKIFSNGANFLTKGQDSILSAAFIIMVSIVASRILGLVRYRLLAGYFGNSPTTLDSFIAASAVPDAIFEVFIFGAVAVAFIPIFSSLMSRNQKKEAWRLASSMIDISIVFFLVIGLFVFIFAQNLAQVVAPGLAAKAENGRLVANLIRLMLFSQIFFVAGTFLTSLLQSFRRFLIPAIASIFYNVGIILGIIFLSPIFGIYGPALGMTLGALIFMILQLPLSYSHGFRFSFKMDLGQDERKVIKLMVPRSLSLAAVRINDLVNVALASLLSAGSIVVFNFAQVLSLVPVALFGGSIAQAALPTLAGHSGNNDKFEQTFVEAFHQILFFTLPAASILAILRIPVVRLVYGAGQFPWELTVLTGRTLIAFAIGLVAQSLVLLTSRAFYAVNDTKTPVAIAAASIAVDVVLSLLFVFVLKLPVIYLALSYSIGNLTSLVLSVAALSRKLGGFNRPALLLPSFKMTIAATVMSVSLYIPVKLLDQLVFDTTRTVGLLILTGIATLCGLVVYLFLTWLFAVKEFFLVWHFISRFGNIKKTLAKPPVVIDGSDTHPQL